ncbi:MAG: glycoside hydrolase family 15 protein [Acidobacteria bacterium]|nr:glycoside hydrolase family 15 protein [Acidobacteriota bacterium]
MSARIEDYALIGDCETAALVDKNGSIDWLCWPAFSSEACFAKLLGTDDNGFWRIAPSDGEWTTSRKYREHTLIVETVFETKDWAVRLTDFMPVRGKNSDVVRFVEGIRGETRMCMELSLRFDYGRSIPWVNRIEGGIRAIAGPNLCVLRASVPTHGENLKTIAEFAVSEGKRVWFTLTYGLSHEKDPAEIDVDEAFKDTVSFWEDWAGQLQFEGEHREIVERSLITLKAMTYLPTGGVVAAVTTSLPESLGGVRNWDYRYCWLRDTTFTLLALANGGYADEAAAWQDWLLRALGGSPDQVQIMYGLSGERQLQEWTVDWLAGYENSKPVRIGNAAAMQVQLDIYGEILDSFYHAQHKMGRHTEQDFRILVLLLKHLEEIWEQPDQGIWETRGRPQQFTYSKLMAWVAFDRAVLIAEQLKYEAPVERWKELREIAHQQICEQGFNEKKNSFVQVYGGEQLDASLLLMPLVGFLPGTDERIKGTVDAIKRELMQDGLVLRYNTSRVQDGLPPGEGVFLACSFWMVSSLKAVGREDEARELFKQLLELPNEMGLLSEEYDPKAKRMVGNFPQAFSHIALVNAVFDLEDGVGVRERARRHSHR